MPLITPVAANNPRRKYRGITLMEVTLATVIVGVAVLSLVKLTTSVAQQNSYSQKVTTALMLANDIRELTATLPFKDPVTGTHTAPDAGEISVAQFNDVQDFNNFTANPPIDAMREPLTLLPNWRQQVTVTLAGDNNGQNLGVTGNLAASAERVQVVISYLPPGAGVWQTILSESWLKTQH